MKLSFARIVTNDVPALTRFYRELTGITPSILNHAYVEFHATGASLSISGQAAMDTYGARATTPRANRSMVLDFEVDDVDREFSRVRGDGMRDSPAADQPAVGQSLDDVPRSRG
jgi:hypothetical protein